MDFSTFTLRTNAHDIINITTQDNRPSKDETFVIMMMMMMIFVANLRTLNSCTVHAYFNV
jgi:hypothetical protein